MRQTGKYAYVNGVPCTQGWQVGRTSSVTTYQASCVPGASGATPGNTDETGNMKGLGFIPPFPTGENMAFVGVVNPKLGSYLNYFGDILVTDCSIKIPVKAGTPISWSANFGVQGELEKDETTGYLDPTRESAPSAKWGRVEISDTGSGWEFVERVQDITLNFKRPASTTVEDGTTEREGGNLEVDISFQVDNDDLMVDLYLLNQFNYVRVYVTETEYFLFDSIIWQAHSNFNVDRSQNPPPIVGYTVNGKWTALRPDQDHLGSIILPDSFELYPADSST